MTKQLVDMREAIRQAIDEEMLMDRNVFLMGRGGRLLQWTLQGL